ncbi:N-acetyltransferase [Mycobacterium antarcticum]|uniref:GNAT family N-acetyltransferase n=1 Tax=Mycolicibacterium sp. TUM20983 TaxID=3023369 RepID=UPI0023852B83|nr:GNAT family N-acetyltransferase [Mycolicibacterium sp. TUM20983]GLP72955.1 N-acetyltransferase [Mycolicibacterium sp. TUM20983]
MTTDKTGAETTVAAEADRFTIAVDGQIVGLAEYSDRDGRRTFPHTEVDRAFQGRGLATILVAEALQATREAGLRIVPACSMVADYIDHHPEYEDITDTV